MLGVCGYAVDFLAAFAVPAKLALAQAGKAALPVNTHFDFSGSDWGCNKPNRKSNLACASGD
jgi:hypothetical protein